MIVLPSMNTENQTISGDAIDQKASTCLKKYFGYDQFRNPQLEIIKHVVSGNDALVIMPTGGGKSICYQIPSLILEGLTLVVSPLIALMQDQVSGLVANGISAAAFNSHTSESELKEIYKKAFEGKLDLLYVSPERLNTDVFRSFIKTVKLALVAVDESHCVSIWGNDFRPDYVQISSFRTANPETPFLALTATADSATQQDIMAQLQLKNAKLFLSSFERKNITMRVSQGLDRMGQILRFIKQNPGSGIIYCLSKKNTEQVAEGLNKKGIKAVYYHAGMKPEDRKIIQSKFINDDIEIICATIAFGMGIDKSNIRWVIHYNLPKNIEGFYQEIGRAGRDGLPSKSLLFFSYNDYNVLTDFVTKSEANEEFKRVQYEKLDRMLDFANSMECRTNVILNYFGEYRDNNCGHCDNCLNPPKSFDGTKIAQMAMSALVRTAEGIAIQMLVDILRGSNKKEVLEKGFDKIKTFGVGREFTEYQWRDFIVQLIHKGYIRIDFVNQSVLKLTPLSEAVLFGKHPIKLTHLNEKIQKEAAPLPKVDKKQEFEVELLEKLKSWRLEKARTEGVPPYIVFNDNTLKEIASNKPLFVEELLEISGIGDVKFQKYGSEIMEVLQNAVVSDETNAIRKGKTYLETKMMLDQGMSPQEIASKREISLSTVFSHLGYLHEKGENINIMHYIDKQEINEVFRIATKINEFVKTGPIFEELEGSIGHEKIRLSLSFLRKEGKIEK